MNANDLQFEPSSTYVIRLKGILSEQWVEWFEGMHIEYDSSGNTLLTGEIADQAAMFGLLNKVRDVGVTLLSITRIEK